MLRAVTFNLKVPSLNRLQKHCGDLMKLNEYWKNCSVGSPNIFIKNYTEYEFACEVFPIKYV